MPQLTQFEGRWRISRRIEDHWLGAQGLFEGVARFYPGAGGLLYSEVGELRLPQEMPRLERRAFVLREGGEGIEVLFEDGAPFHTIAAGARVVQDWFDHPPETYEISYNFSHWPKWRVIWKVQGPRKDYTAISDFCAL